MRWCLYVDMDAFYVSCELRDHPELRGQPVAVGPDPRKGPVRGVVLSASYEARTFGLRSAMPVGRAHALCPTAVWLPANFRKYEAAAQQVRSVLLRFSSEVVPYSIDEAAVWVEAAGAEEAGALAGRVQSSIADELQLPSSIGVSPFRTVAKIATDLAKPRGIRVVPPEDTQDFLAPLPVRAVPGVGPKTEAILEGLGIRTVGELRGPHATLLQRRFGSFGEELMALASGTPREASELEVGPPKSRSSDRTLNEDSRDVELLEEAVRTLAEEAARGVQAEGFRYETVTLRIRWEDFQQVQRGHTLGAAREGTEPSVREAIRLLRELLQDERAGRNRRVRLLSVRLGGLRPRLGTQRRLDRYLRAGRPRGPHAALTTADTGPSPKR